MNPTGSYKANKTGFAGLYLERYSSGPGWELPQPDPDLFLSVIVPAYKEPDIESSLEALLSCSPPEVRWEILVVVNYPENSSREVIDISAKTRTSVLQVSQELIRNDVSIHALWLPDMPKKHAGVGLARKAGMDEAVRRFNEIGRPEGIIISFDADSTCAPGYLSEIVAFYAARPKARTANIYFEHPLEGPLDSACYRSIEEYELYLRYIRLAIERTGHPHAIHTVGSSFSLRAMTYVRANGMGRYQAGEDFYFLHKCVQLGQFYEINTTVVYPSSRESDRVAFGTGATIRKQLRGDEPLNVYSLSAFGWLTGFFSKLESLYGKIRNGSTAGSIETGINPEISEFINQIDLDGKIRELIGATASYATFRDRFFAWFNGFLVLRYLNEMHVSAFSKSPVLTEASALALQSGMPRANSVGELLDLYRDFEKRRGIRRIT
ncbi:MAG: glycosyltransferase family 2 protein [Bacteroidota bacterium]